ncbi:MAG: trypsin-like peptidase domain-containing protein [bacterium]|nr:trypsin-like peptidase domain-containing protein [bacterium]
MKMKTQKGFIQIPILIAIIAGVLVLGGDGYLGVKQYQNRQIVNPKNENRQITTTPDISEVEKLRQEVEELKKQSAQNQNKVSVNTKDTAVISTGKKNGLTNAQIITKIKPATVYIKTQTAVGSGMIFSPDGYVLTNAHVVEDAMNVDISLSTGVTFTGTVVGRDEVIDLAVIKINTTKQLPKVDFDDSDKVEQGDNVFTFGFPFGIEGNVSFKEGTISRRIGNYLETSAEIHPGNSGGPLVNKFGQIIGVNTAAFGKSVDGVQFGETIKLAIPINVAKDIIPDLKIGRNVVLPKKPKQQYTPAPTYDYSPPIITSITAERPPGSRAVIKIMIETNEESITSVSFSFKYTPELEAQDKVWSASSDSARKIFTVSVPYPSWNENTELIVSVKAVDIKGNVSKTESYSMRFVSIPGTTGATYTQPLIIK